jgi:uncharacterized lipoprotein YddW (UPF0748 family)
MTHIRFLIGLTAMLSLSVLNFLMPLNAAAQETATPIPPPAPVQEFRGVWIATVSNIDWPSRKDLSTEQQKAELIDLLDRAKALRLNAVIFQVRPAADALYSSALEPWSEYLTGQMGKAPEPFYDPLAFAVEEAHRRGLELHAWFNPYRARQALARSVTAPNHVSSTHPELVKNYGRLQWLDPGEPRVMEHTIRVILDVVRRYDVDGIHLDDYFYPYLERDANGQIIAFPDNPSWQRYQNAGGKLERSEWRRENVNTLVRRLYGEIKGVKPWVKFGISPFGIWKSGVPAQIRGLNAYEELYADSRKWLNEGWVDYFTPQLYWKIEARAQSYPVLLNWWTQQNAHNRHIWPGNSASRASSGGANDWPDSEIEYQVRVTRGQAGATGNVYFSAQGLLRRDPDGLTKRLAESVYSEAALVPASPWLDATPPSKPDALALAPIGVAPVGTAPATSTAERIVTWRSSGREPVWLWLVQHRAANAWASTILPGNQTSFTVPPTLNGPAVAEVAVSAIDRVGNQSAVARILLPSTEPK